MPRKNLAMRADIEAGTLRQSRDLYALGIGLTLFNLAGGQLNPDATLATLLPIRLSYPVALLAAAWVGFFYLLWRFWLLSDLPPCAIPTSTITALRPGWHPAT